MVQWWVMYFHYTNDYSLKQLFYCSNFCKFWFIPFLFSFFQFLFSSTNFYFWLNLMQWVLSSKEINFPYPLGLTLLHMTFSSVLCFLLTKVFKVSHWLLRRPLISLMLIRQKRLILIISLLVKRSWRLRKEWH